MLAGAVLTDVLLVAAGAVPLAIALASTHRELETARDEREALWHQLLRRSAASGSAPGIDRPQEETTVSPEEPTSAEHSGVRHEDRQCRRAQKFTRVLADLDRCPHGRHEGDSCAGWSAAEPARGCRGGVSLGNPHLPPPGTVLGYDLYGNVIAMPPRGSRGQDPNAWRRAEDAPRPVPGATHVAVEVDLLIKLAAGHRIRIHTQRLDGRVESYCPACDPPRYTRTHHVDERLQCGLYAAVRHLLANFGVDLDAALADHDGD